MVQDGYVSEDEGIQSLDQELDDVSMGLEGSTLELHHLSHSPSDRAGLFEREDIQDRAGRSFHTSFTNATYLC